MIKTRGRKLRDKQQFVAALPAPALVRSGMLMPISVRFVGIRRPEGGFVRWLMNRWSMTDELLSSPTALTTIAKEAFVQEQQYGADRAAAIADYWRAYTPPFLPLMNYSPEARWLLRETLGR